MFYILILHLFTLITHPLVRSEKRHHGTHFERAMTSRRRSEAPPGTLQYLKLLGGEQKSDVRETRISYVYTVHVLMICHAYICIYIYMIFFFPMENYFSFPNLFWLLD